MSRESVAAARVRVESVFRQRPVMGLHALVEEARVRSPIGVAVEAGSPFALTVEIGEA